MIYVLIPSTPERKDRLALAVASIKASVCTQPIEIVIEISEGEGANKPFYRMLQKVDGLVFNFGDDASVASDFIQKLYDAYVENFPDQDGVCAADDGINDPRAISGFALAHSKTWLENFNPEYVHLFADREWTAIMKNKNRYCPVLTAKAYHHHYTKESHIKFDKTYQWAESHQQEDAELFNKRLLMGFGRLSFVTAVLITKEKEYPKAILDRLQGFGEIIIKTQSPDVYTRYLEAGEAKNDIVYVQDDDCFINHQELFKHYDGRLTNSMTPHHFNAYKDTGATLVGWGCFFPKPMLKVFEKYVAEYGQDFHLFREADRIFTVLNQPFNTKIMPHEDLLQSSDRMSFEPNHYIWAKEAIQKASLLT